MLKLRDVCKYYYDGKNKKVVLDNINIDFRSHELVFILGPSGCGKSTLLNIISGNLKIDKGNIYYNNEIINKYSDRKLDNFRRIIVSSIFQDYNLIEYMNVYDNIKIGNNKNVSHKEIANIINKMGLNGKEHVGVSKLSGGEKQRVAIARALARDSKIILCDEPTGALDSDNSIKIMEILKKISNDKLVIVVSHDMNLANKYADRIININYGKVVYQPVVNDNENIFIEKTKNKFYGKIKLAFKNLWLKKVRTLFTSLAISLGIISMIMVLSIASNFNNEIDDLEKRMASIGPIVIYNGNVLSDSLIDENIKNDKIMIDNGNYYENKINDKYLEYINNILEIDKITYRYNISMPIISDNLEIIDNRYLEEAPSYEYIMKNYEIISGRNINNKNEVLLKVDSNNRVSYELLNSLGIYSDIDYNYVIGKKLKVIINDDYYIKNDDYYYINQDKDILYNSSNIELTIVGIVKEKEIYENNALILYDKEITKDILAINKDSMIVNSQLVSNYSVLGNNMDKDIMLSYLGYKSTPDMIKIYVNNLNNKEKVINKLDKYNKDNNKILYVDTVKDMIKVVKDFISVISIVLILFSGIAIFVSLILTGILTNVRVLERRRDIGILRSLGISKHNIKSLLGYENVIIGIIASIISILVLAIIKNPVNSLIDKVIGINDLFVINYYLVIVVSIINILVVRISGSIPAINASRMEIVKCIYNR